MATRRVNTATLVRGAIYSVRHPLSTDNAPIDPLRFEAGVPVIVKDSKVLDMLAGLVDITEDGDGDQYEKPRFLIERGVSAPDEHPTPQRLSSSSTVRIKRRPNR